MATLVLVVAVAGLALLLQFLAPEVSYQVRDRLSEAVSDGRGRHYRIALGARAGSNYRIGEALNRHLQARAGYALELVETVSPGNVAALLDPSDRIDLATISSADDEAVRAEGLVGIAALEQQHFFVVVANDNPVEDFRDLTGRVNPGVRSAGDPPTLGERVLEYYGMLAQGADGAAPQVAVVRPQDSNLQDLESGHNTATTRTQFLRSELIERMLRTGGYRLLPIRDHEALAALLPGTTAAFIPPGLYGPGRRIPSEPVPTIAVTQLLVARAEIPGRVVRDILDVIYSPRFQRDVQYALREDAGRDVSGLPLHRAAEIFYHRHDAITSDRLGRLSFVASAIAGLFAVAQFVSSFRRGERVRRRRRLVAAETVRLQAIRQRIGESPDTPSLHGLIRAADELLSAAEQDAAVDTLDAESIRSLRSLHRLCRLAYEGRAKELASPMATGAPELVARGPEESPPARADHIAERTTR